MKVVQLISSLEFGGVEKYAVQLHNEFRHELITEAVESYFLSLKTGPLIELLSNRKHCLILKNKNNINSILKAIKFIKNNEIDIIHAHNDSIIYAVFLRIMTGTKIIFHNHHGSMGIKKSIKYSRIKLISPFLNYVITVNERLESFSKKYLLLSKSKIQYIPNFISTSKSGSVPSLPGEKSKRVVCLANLNPVKDHLTLIKAFELVVETVPEAILILIGDTKNKTYKTTLKKLVLNKNLSDHVYFTGAVLNPQDYMNQCSIGVLTSKMEAFPLSLLEYSTSSLAVVVSNVGQIPTVLENGRLGLLVRPGDIDGFAESMVKLLTDESMRATYSKLLTSKVENTFGKNKIIKQITKVYNDLL